MRAYVLARKGVLASNPDVKNMTRTQWMLEYHALAQRERELFEIYFKALRQSLVGVLGLNAIRPEDGNGNPKDYEHMTQEEKDDFLPLIAWVGRPELLKIAAEQIENKVDPDKVVGDESYESLVDAIDAAGGDIEPILGLDKIPTVRNPQRKHHEEIFNIKDRSELDIDVEDI